MPGYNKDRVSNLFSDLLADLLINNLDEGTWSKVKKCAEETELGRGSQYRQCINSQTTGVK